MSRVGKSPVAVPAGVKVSISGKTVQVEGPKGKLIQKVHERIGVEVAGAEVLVTRSSEEKADKALHGTTRALINNMVSGVSRGFTKELEIRGVGYRGEQKGKSVNLVLGYSHPVVYEPPTDVTVKMEGNLKIIVTGSDRQKVGQVAAEIRGFKPPEPYKGKGIRYIGEQVIQKEVKKS